MRNTNQDERVTRTSPGGGSLGRAWIAVALIPVFLVLTAVVGEGLYRLMGYLPYNTYPLWVDLVASISSLVVFLVPCAAAVLYGRRAKSGSSQSGV